jgi:hypothetical protein
MEILLQQTVIDVVLAPVVVEVVTAAVVNVSTTGVLINYIQAEYVYQVLVPIVLSVAPTLIMTLAINGLVAQPRFYQVTVKTLSFDAALDLIDGDIINITYY